MPETLEGEPVQATEAAQGAHPDEPECVPLDGRDLCRGKACLRPVPREGLGIERSREDSDQQADSQEVQYGVAQRKQDGRAPKLTGRVGGGVPDGSSHPASSHTIRRRGCRGGKRRTGGRMSILLSFPPVAKQEQ